MRPSRFAATSVTFAARAGAGLALRRAPSSGQPRRSPRTSWAARLDPPGPVDRPRPEVHRRRAHGRRSSAPASDAASLEPDDVDAALANGGGREETWETGADDGDAHADLRRRPARLEGERPSASRCGAVAPSHVAQDDRSDASMPVAWNHGDMSPPPAASQTPEVPD